jgi:hypothetical protein
MFVWFLYKHVFRTRPISDWCHCPLRTDKLWGYTVLPVFHCYTPCWFGNSVTRSFLCLCWLVALQANKALLVFIRMLHLVTFKMSETSCCNARCHTTSLHVFTQWRCLTRSALYGILGARNVKLCKETDRNITTQLMWDVSCKSKVTNMTTMRNVKVTLVIVSAVLKSGIDVRGC